MCCQVIPQVAHLVSVAHQLLIVRLRLAIHQGIPIRGLTASAEPAEPEYLAADFLDLTKGLILYNQ